MNLFGRRTPQHSTLLWMHELEKRVATLEKKMSEIDDLRAQVQHTNEIVASATVLINGIHQRLVQAGTDAKALTQLATDLKSNTDALANAVAANSSSDTTQDNTGAAGNTGGTTDPAAPPATPPTT